MYESVIPYQIFVGNLENKSNAKSSMEPQSNPIFPCVLRILGEYIFNRHNPIIIGANVEEGILRLGTPIVIITKMGETSPELIEIWYISNIQKEYSDLQEAFSGDEVVVEIVGRSLYGEDFDVRDRLYSKMAITRESIDALKSDHPEIVKQRPIFELIKKLKALYKIV